MKNQANQITVNKADYEVFEYSSGYFGISKIDKMGANPVYGGDSADEDNYSKEIVTNVYDAWDGILTDCGTEKYGESGYTL